MTEVVEISLSLPEDMNIHPQTQAMLEMLEGVEMFSHCGMDERGQAVTLHSWEEAIQYACSEVSDSTRLAAKNEFGRMLRELNQNRFNQWNDHAKILKEMTEELVARKTRKVIELYNLPESFANYVDWDVFHICLHAEYSDVCQLSFYTRQASWYVKGHFPSGWKGQYPDGDFVVY